MLIWFKFSLLFPVHNVNMDIVYFETIEMYFYIFWYAWKLKIIKCYLKIDYDWLLRYSTL